ncbi:bZIP transcription factor TGA10-like isoform X2 [Wolffia australiana]
MSKRAANSPPRRNQSQEQQQISFGVVQPSSSLPSSFMNKDGGTYDLGELDQALFLYLDGHEHPTVQDQKQTLNIFPSQPMHVDPTTKGGLGSPPPATFAFKRPPDRFNNSARTLLCAPDSEKDVKPADKREASGTATTSSGEQASLRTLDPKTLRRLAQNREAARKSRLRKKAYIQQLESSRIKLSQLEQELQRARSQGVLAGGVLGDQAALSGIGCISADAAMFDVEYARWLEDHHRLTWELRAAVHENLPENELRMFVDSCLAHYDEISILKSTLTKCDVFHLVSGVWKTPAERCFMWLGGFRPSDIIKIIMGQIEPLSEQQMMGLYSLRAATDQAESALSQGLDDLLRSLSDTIASNELSFPSNMAHYMGQMAMAVSKLSNLEGLVRQADELRRQTLHRLNQMLSTRQAARCFLALGEYFHRLRALSSLWQARPRHE